MPNRYFPFEALGFHANPFRALTEDEWATIAVLPSEIQELVEQEDTHLQILGEAGHGKSTLLRGLSAKLEEIGQQVCFEYLPLGQRHFKTPSAKIVDIDVFLLDEVQRLTRRQRKQLFSLVTDHQIRLMIGSHEDFTPRFSKNGMSLATILLEDIDEHVLSEMLVKRMDYFRTDGQSKVYVEADAVDYLIARFGRNLRQLEYYLYEVFQYLAEQQQIEPISAELLTEIDPYIVIDLNLVGPE